MALIENLILLNSHADFEKLKIFEFFNIQKIRTLR